MLIICARARLVEARTSTPSGSPHCVGCWKCTPNDEACTIRDYDLKRDVHCLPFFYASTPCCHPRSCNQDFRDLYVRFLLSVLQSAYVHANIHVLMCYGNKVAETRSFQAHPHVERFIFSPRTSGLGPHETGHRHQS